MKWQTEDYIRSKAANGAVGGMTETIMQQKAEWQEDQRRIADD